MIAHPAADKLLRSFSSVIGFGSQSDPAFVLGYVEMRRLHR